MPKIVKPQFVNRGGAGLLKKLPEVAQKETLPEIADGKKNNIAPALKTLIVSIEGLVPDPNNARVHNERNIEAIKNSLRLYGQVRPITVRKKGKIVIAGNGTLQSATELGWTKIAATFVDMDDIQAAGYGIADNRTAELARWDLETVKRIDRLLQEKNLYPIGFSLDELQVLRLSDDWKPPEMSDKTFGGNGDGKKDDPLIVSFTPDEYGVVGQAVMLLREEANDQQLSQEKCIEQICMEWLEFKEQLASGVDENA